MTKESIIFPKEDKDILILRYLAEGLSHAEIADTLDIHRTTVDRHVNDLKADLQIKMNAFFREDMVLEYARYLTMSNEMIRELRTMMNDETLTPEQRRSCISLLNDLSKSRLQTVFLIKQFEYNKRSDTSR